MLNLTTNINNFSGIIICTTFLLEYINLFNYSIEQSKLMYFRKLLLGNIIEKVFNLVLSGYLDKYFTTYKMLKHILFTS